MGIMGFLRDRMGKILAFFIGFALFAFIVGEVVKSGGSFFRDDRNLLGEVSGEKIAYDDYQKLYDQLSAQFKQQSGSADLTPQITAYAQESAWGQLVREKIFQKEIDKLGLVVGTDETQSMISGNNPDPAILQYFGDSQGRLDRTKLNTFLTNYNASKADDPIRAQWAAFTTQLIENKLNQKYTTLISNGLYVNSLEAKESYTDKNKLANFKYVTLDYASVPDNKVTLTDADYQDYYNDHVNEFKNQQELRTFDYVSFNAAPSKADSAAVKAKAEKLAADFKTSTNDSLFVQVNSETKLPLVFLHKGKGLEPKIDSVMFGAEKGFVYGPYLTGSSYKIAKLVDSRVEPDSVKARHILIDDKTIGVEKAIAKADSLKKLIQGGKSFAELANTFSIDKNSAVKGGDLGTFARNTMVPAFEDAVFKAQKGQLLVVPTQFGVHLIEVEDLKGNSKVIKVGLVDVPLKASTTTQAAIYSKAQAFLANLTNENFDSEAKKENLKTQLAPDVNGVAISIPGIESARDIVKWAFGAKAGDFSDKVYDTGNQYIVAHLVSIKPKGTLSLADVKKQIEPMVKNKAKGKILTDKLQAALNGSSSIDQVAQKAGAKVNPIQNIVFANPVIPGTGPEYKLIGSVFGSQPNKLSKPVEGMQGVFVFSVDSFVNPAPATNLVREKEQIAQMMLQRSQSQIFDALKDKANVKDYRAKFL